MNNLSKQETVRSLHDEAMRYAHLARIARHEGEIAQANEFARSGARLEAQAARLVPQGPEAEPTRSILYRSAASLAFQAEDFTEARQLVALGLSGSPNIKVEKELLALFDNIKLQLNLRANRQALEEADVRMSLQGDAVGAGFILYSELQSRVDIFFKLISRTVQRMMHRTYQSGGRISALYKPFKPAISTAEAGSYIVTLRLTRDEQYTEPLLNVTAAQVIDEVIRGLEFIEASAEDSLRNIISDEPYFENFVNLSKNIAPDGSRISAVGLTSTNRAVGLTRTREEIITTPKIDPGTSDSDLRSIDIIGILDKADDQESKGVIGITSEEGQHYQIRLNAGIDDIVSMNWKKRVHVIGTFNGTHIFSSDIQPLD